MILPYLFRELILTILLTGAERLVPLSWTKICGNDASSPMNTSSHLRVFVVGVHIEVLWDIENTKTEGRRSGEKLTKSLWWRGEVTELEDQGSYLVAKIRYESLEGFKTQTDEVRVLPFHIQMVSDGEVTQLRWRFFECSGDVRYDGDDKETGSSRSLGAIEQPFPEQQDSQLLTMVHRNFENLRSRVEQVERLLVTHREVVRSLPTSAYSSDTCERIFTLVRHKLALEVQKPLARFRSKAEPNERTTRFDRSCAGSIRSHIDCTTEEFETICGDIASRNHSAYLLVDGSVFSPQQGSLSSSFNVAEILFESLTGLCDAVGITSKTDVMKIARRESIPTSSDSSDDAAVRLCGCFLADADVENTPSAMLICQSLHAGVDKSGYISTLWREKRDLDNRTVWYCCPLEVRKIPVNSLMHLVYGKGDSVSASDGAKPKLKRIHTDVGCFALQFKPYPNVKGRMWSRSMIPRNHFVGSIEVEIPYVLIRGQTAVKELNTIVDNNFIIH